VVREREREMMAMCVCGLNKWVVVFVALSLQNFQLPRMKSIRKRKREKESDEVRKGRR
jgi:hypothetical protein